MVPSAAVLVGAAGAAAFGAPTGLAMLGGDGIAAILAARGMAAFGAATRGFGAGATFGARADFTVLGTGGAELRTDGAGGDGTLRRRGGLALGNAAVFLGRAGALIFAGAGTLATMDGGGGGGFLARTGGGALTVLGMLDGFGLAIAGGGTRRRTGGLGVIFTGGTARGLAAIRGAGRVGAGKTGGGRWRAVAKFGGGRFVANSAGRLKLERGGVAGGGNSAVPGLGGGGAARGVRSSPGKVGWGPSLSRTLRSTMTLGRLEPGE